MQSLSKLQSFDPFVFQIDGDNIFNAFHKQIMEYTIYKSLFDVVALAIFRFIILIFFYAILYVNHWSIIAVGLNYIQ